MGKKMTSKKDPAPAVIAFEIPSGTKPTKANVVDISMETISLGTKNDRTRDAAFEAGIRELAGSIGQVGLQQPIVVIAYAKLKGFYIVAGERRWRACSLLGWKSIPGTIAPAGSSIEDARLAENIQREDLNDEQKALQIAERYGQHEAKVLEEMGVKDASTLDAPARDAVRRRAIKSLATLIGWPEKRVREYVFIAELPQATRALAGTGRLGIGHLRVLAQVADPKRCDELAKTYAAGVDQAAEPMQPLDDLKDVVGRELARLDKVAWDLNIEFASAPSCAKCPSNSRNRTGLFDGEQFDKDGEEITAGVEEKAGVCLKLSCFQNKKAATTRAISNAGDRIAGAVVKLTGKAKLTELNTQVREANAKTAFVLPTVFRKQVLERVEAKLKKPAGKAKPSAGQSKKNWNTETPQQAAKRQAGYKLSDAIRKRSEKLLKEITPRLRKLSPISQLLIDVTGNTPDAETAKDLRDSTENSKHLARVRSLMRAAINDSPLNAITLIVAAFPSDAFNPISYQEMASAPYMDMIAAELGITELPPVPKLEDFLPKPKKAEAKPAAKDEKSKTHKPAKAKDAAKPAGKKKAKKSKMSPAAPAPAAADEDDSIDPPADGSDDSSTDQD